jgi:hypothetical protein
MNVEELNAFVQTTEGAAWLEGQKAPLVSKNQELLGELKASGGRLATEAQRAADSARLLDEERSSVSHLIVDRELDRLLDAADVFPVLKPSVLAQLKAIASPTIVADGLDRKAVAKYPGADGKLEDVSLEEMVNRWKETPEAKTMRRALGSAGGGAHGGAGTGGGDSKTMRMGEFSQMKVSEQGAFIRKGGRVVD